LRKLGLLVGLVAIAFVVPTNADVIILSNSDFNARNPENILFNEPGLEAGPALTVQGSGNQTGLVVDFTSDVDLVTPSGGQARIEADVGFFTSLMINLSNPAGTFDAVEFNLDVEDDGTLSASILTNTGLQAIDVPLDASGQNRIAFGAINSQTIISVLLESDVDIEIARQIRIAGAAVSAIPEPGTMFSMGAGLIVAVLTLRKRSRRD
jgi:hypothetical protein